MTPNIQFVRNDLFERIIKSCKATSVEFLMIKEKLGLHPYRVICDKQEFILPEIQDDIEKLKKENEEPKEIKSFEKPKEISFEESIKIKSPKEDNNLTDWYDKNKFKEILAIAGSNKFNHKNKMCKFK